ncbi:MAG: hypothetical protein ACI4JV_02650 [Ruminiclostridium sp.]
MIYSELSLIEKETGLTYDPETATLSGVKNGVPVVVFDNDKKHRFDIVCGAVINERQFARIYTMAERFPKKTILGVENVDGCVNIYCKGYNLMQENLPLLIEFLEKLTAYLKKEMRKTTPVQVAKVLELEDYAILTKRVRSDGTVRPPYNIKGTVKGIFGGLLGLVIGSAIFVAFIMMSDLVGWLGGIIMSAAVVSLYTVFSKKLKTVDCIMTAILTFAGWALSNGFAFLFQIFLKEQESGSTVNVFGILNNLASYSMQYTELAGNMLNRLIVTFIFVVAGAIGSYVFYFKHHTKDMY